MRTTSIGCPFSLKYGSKATVQRREKNAIEADNRWRVIRQGGRCQLGQLIPKW